MQSRSQSVLHRSSFDMSDDQFQINGSSSYTSSDEYLMTSTTTELIFGTPSAIMEDEPNLNLIYTASEAIVACLAMLGNSLVVYVFCMNRPLRRYRNYYIIGLAVADFLVGLLAIPLALMASVGLPRNNLYGCLFSVSILMVLCTISISCLVAVSVDRYWATTNPFAYYRNMTTSTSIGIILSCWFVGAVIGFLPLFGWYNREGWYTSQGHCYFTKVMDYNYIVFIYFTTIVCPALLMACFYGYIYHIVLIKIRQKGTLVPSGRRQSETSRSGSLSSDLRDSTQMMRMVSEKRREGKAAKKLSIIVLFFMICWMPLYTINCVEAFCSSCKAPSELLYFTIILSHANSAMNPFLYAYHLKEFRLAMRNALYGLAGRLSCGRIKDPLPKEISVSVSRTLTMPTIATNSSLGTKYSTKFRKVGFPASSSGDEVQMSSPNGRQLHRIRTTLITASTTVLSSSPSKQNILHPGLSSDKSISSLSQRSQSRESLNYQLEYDLTRRHPAHQFTQITQSELTLTTSSPDESDELVCQKLEAETVLQCLTFTSSHPNFLISEINSD